MQSTETRVAAGGSWDVAYEWRAVTLLGIGFGLVGLDRWIIASLLPLGTKVAHKTGTGYRCYNDAGIIFKGDRPLLVLSAYTSNVPETLKDGTPGFASAYQLIGRMARLAWDDLGR